MRDWPMGLFPETVGEEVAPGALQPNTSGSRHSHILSRSLAPEDTQILSESPPVQVGAQNPPRHLRL